MTKYPDIEIDLSGTDGNAVYIMMAVKNALASGGVDADQQREFLNQATSGDYDNLIKTAMEWVNVI